MRDRKGENEKEEKRKNKNVRSTHPNPKAHNIHYTQRMRDRMSEKENISRYFPISQEFI